MTLERLLPFILLGLYVLLALVRSLHVVRAPQSRPAAAATPAPVYEGWGSKAMRTGAAAALALCVTLYGFFHTFAIFHWFGAFGLPLPAWLRAAGIPAALAGIALVHWSHRALGRHFSVELETGREHELITLGPYARVRHPMYAAFILFFLSSALVSAHALIALFSAGLSLWMWLRIPVEERMLRERFGAAYEDYMQRTGRLWPGRG